MHSVMHTHHLPLTRCTVHLDLIQSFVRQTKQLIHRKRPTNIFWWPTMALSRERLPLAASVTPTVICNNKGQKWHAVAHDRRGGNKLDLLGTTLNKATVLCEHGLMMVIVLSVKQVGTNVLMLWLWASSWLGCRRHLRLFLGKESTIDRGLLFVVESQ